MHDDDDGPSADAYEMLRLLEVAGGGLDIRALLRRARLPPDRLKAAIEDARRLRRVNVRPPAPGRACRRAQHRCPRVADAARPALGPARLARRGQTPRLRRCRLQFAYAQGV